MYDVLNVNVHNVNKVTNDYTTISKKFKSKQLELQQACNNIEQT